MKLIQFISAGGQRRIGVSKGEKVQLVKDIDTVYNLFYRSLHLKLSMQEVVEALLINEFESIDKILTEGRMRVPLDHPDPYHVFLTGTGLTHSGSAKSRDAMHEKKSTEKIQKTDSMKMFEMGIENGKPSDGKPGVQPEWFYKGNGLMITHPGYALDNPSFAMDGGEEPEIAGLYIIDPQGNPVCLGFAMANEFSDHVMEKQNYLYLAHSKLRTCSYGPELLLGDLPPNIKGKSKIIRNGKTYWENTFLTGEDNMNHSIKNLEHHHFKYHLFRQPGDVHVHFFGTSVLSFSDGIKTKPGDIFSIESDAFNIKLTNALN